MQGPNPDNKAPERRLRGRRMTSPAGFRAVFDAEHSEAGRFVVVWAAGHDTATGVRMGVIASKRTFRRAVDRSRAKRLLREAFRLNAERFADNVDLILVARRRILEAGCAEVEADLIRAGHRLGVCKGDGKQA